MFPRPTRTCTTVDVFRKTANKYTKPHLFDDVGNVGRLWPRRQLVERTHRDVMIARQRYVNHLESVVVEIQQFILLLRHRVDVIT